MTNIGVVVHVNNGEATVRFIRKGPCSDNCQMCGACKIDPLEIKASCSLPVSAGDHVEVYSPDGAVVFGLICLFLFPVILPIIAYVLLSEVLGGTASLIISLLVLAGCGAMIFLLNRSKQYISRTKPTVISKL